MAPRVSRKTAELKDGIVAYDVELADRLRELLSNEPRLTEKEMFGGLAFLIGGNMAIAASGQGGVLVRVDPAKAERIVATSPAELAVMRGRALEGWLRVASEHLRTTRQLARWAAVGAAPRPNTASEEVAFGLLRRRLFRRRRFGGVPLTPLGGRGAPPSCGHALGAPPRFHIEAVPVRHCDRVPTRTLGSRTSFVTLSGDSVRSLGAGAKEAPAAPDGVRDRDVEQDAEATGGAEVNHLVGARRRSAPVATRRHHEPGAGLTSVGQRDAIARSRRDRQLGDGSPGQPTTASATRRPPAVIGSSGRRSLG